MTPSPTGRPHDPALTVPADGGARRAPEPADTLDRIDSGALASRLRGALRLTIYVLFTFACMPVQILALMTGRLETARRFPVWYHRHCMRLFGFEIKVTGAPSQAQPTLFVSNHSSYLDIMVLGSLAPISFIAKSEVAGWPFFGWLAKLQRTVFVDRKTRNARAHRSEVRSRLEAGDCLVLFAEGTSSDGSRVKPFKSALFSVAEAPVTTNGNGQPDTARRDNSRTGEDQTVITVQPVSIAFTELDHIPAGRSLRPLYAWYGDMDLLPHLWRVAGLGDVTVRVIFHPAVTYDAFGSRKALADYCETQVRAGVSDAISGHLDDRDAGQPGPSGRRRRGASTDAAGEAEFDWNNEPDGDAFAQEESAATDVDAPDRTSHDDEEPRA